MNEEPTSEAAGNPEDTVVVKRTVSQSLKSVWDALSKPAAVETLLGEGARLGGKGDDWQASDGTHGVLRSYHPQEQIRFSWHAAPDAPATMVELDLAAQGEGTELTLTQSKVAEDQRAALSQRWAGALEKFSAALG